MCMLKREEVGRALRDVSVHGEREEPTSPPRSRSSSQARVEIVSVFSCEGSLLPGLSDSYEVFSCEGGCRSFFFLVRGGITT